MRLRYKENLAYAKLLAAAEADKYKSKPSPSGEGFNINSFFMFDPHIMNLQKIVLRVDTREDEKVVRILT